MTGQEAATVTARFNDEIGLTGTLCLPPTLPPSLPSSLPPLFLLPSPL
jgi:hypothetical protein